MAKICRVIQIKFKRLASKMSVWSLIYQQSVFKRYHGDKHFLEFYLQDGGKNQLAYTSLWPYVYRSLLTGYHRIGSDFTKPI